MTEDPYEILGVGKNAGEADIRKAYRALAKKYHPDFNPGDAEAEEKFKKISAAYHLLSDPEQRRRYDAGEIDASGAEKPRENFYRHYAEAESGHPYRSTAGFDDLGDIFSDLFGARARGGRGEEPRMRGADVRYELTVDFLEAVNGARKRVTMPDGQSLDIVIPEGLRDGQMLRLKGKGQPGIGGGPPGDAYVAIHTRPHPLFERRDSDIHMELPVTIYEAALGAKVAVPTPTGSVSMTIPKGSNTGTTLRLKGKGVPDKALGRRGDQYVKLKVVLPDEIDPELERILADWAGKHPYDPRRRMAGGGRG